MSGGIHENVTIKDIIIEKLPAGNKYYIRFVYENEQGLMMQHTEFEPNQRPFQNDEDYQKSIYGQLNRIINNHITPYFGWEDGKYIPDLYETNSGTIEEKTEARKQMEAHLSRVNPQYDGSSFFGFASWLKDKIEDISKTTKLRIKVIYGGTKGYTSLPSYSQYVSVEPMAAEKRQITRLSIDKFEPIPVDDEKKADPKNTDPLSSGTTTNDMSGAALSMGSVNPGIDPLKDSNSLPF